MAAVAGVPSASMIIRITALCHQVAQYMNAFLEQQRLAALHFVELRKLALLAINSPPRSPQSNASAA
jgi:hypothetical protein